MSLLMDSRTLHRLSTSPGAACPSLGNKSLLLRVLCHILLSSLLLQEACNHRGMGIDPCTCSVPLCVCVVAFCARIASVFSQASGESASAGARGEVAHRMKSSRTGSEEDAFELAHVFFITAFTS